MAFDSIDKFFNDMLKRYKHVLGGDWSGNNPVFPESNDVESDDDDAREFEDEHKDNEADIQPRSNPASRRVGYEIISGSNMKDPIVRIFGNPDAFPGLQEEVQRFLKLNSRLPSPDRGTPFVDSNPIGLAPPTDGLPRDRDTSEPFAESYKDKDGGLVINIDMPGVKQDDMSVRVEGRSIRVEAHGDKHDYQKSFPLDVDATSDDIEWYLNNGMLEIKVKVS